MALPKIDLMPEQSDPQTIFNPSSHHGLINLRNTPGFWYLASPYANFDQGYDQAYAEVATLTAALMKAGVVVFSPINHCHPIAHKHNMGRDHRFWLRYDLEILCCAYGLFIAEMKGWEKSLGVNTEMGYAKGRNKPIVHLTDKIIRELRSSWL